ncbi:MAG TPA: hypothetical protein VGX92_17635 [Pyrinomonadaceae bacterium]|jgi:hypothetical protein|nr:hypothetical protein [Pyrinomonadaceae bacterium]
MLILLLFIALLAVVIAVGAALSNSNSQGRPQQIAPPPFRRKQIQQPRRKRILSGSEKIGPPVQHAKGNGNAKGNGIARKKRTVNLDAPCRVTGRTMRVCRCGKCQMLRKNNGA